MPQGLLIQNASGQVVLDTSSSIGRQTGSQTVGASSPYSGTINIPGYVSGETGWAIATFSKALGDPPSPVDFDVGFLSVSGGVITWNYYSATTIVYGLT